MPNGRGIAERRIGVWFCVFCSRYLFSSVGVQDRIIYLFYTKLRLVVGMPSRSNGPITQDWAPVVLHKRPQKASEARDPKAVNAAIRAGAQIQTVKKFDGGLNKKPSPSLNVRKLDEETEPASLEKVSPEVRQAIQKARLDKKLTQVELAKRINERPQVIQEYESGKALPNQLILSKMEKALGVKLRGKLSK